MKRAIRDWLSLIHWLRSPIDFSDFEDLKWPEHYGRDWFYARKRRLRAGNAATKFGYGEVQLSR
jgi:hypothetical protein